MKPQSFIPITLVNFSLENTQLLSKICYVSLVETGNSTKYSFWKYIIIFQNLWNASPVEPHTSRQISEHYSLSLSLSTHTHTHTHTPFLLTASWPKLVPTCKCKHIKNVMVSSVSTNSNSKSVVFSEEILRNKHCP